MGISLYNDPAEVLLTALIEKLSELKEKEAAPFFNQISSTLDNFAHQTKAQLKNRFNSFDAAFKAAYDQKNSNLLSILNALFKNTLEYSLFSIPALLFSYQTESLISKTAAIFLFSGPAFFRFQIRKTAITLASTYYISSQPTPAQPTLTQTNTASEVKQNIPLKDWLALNITHPVLLDLFLFCLNFYLDRLTLGFRLRVLSTFVTTGLSAYFTGFILWQYAFVKQGFTPVQMLNRLAANPLTTLTLGLIPAVSQTLFNYFLWPPLSAGLYSVIFAFAMIQAHQEKLTIEDFPQKKTSSLNPIVALWNANHSLFNLFKGRMPNPNLGDLWATRVNTLKKSRLLSLAQSFFSPYFSYLTFVSNIKNLGLIFPKSLDFIALDLGSACQNTYEELQKTQPYIQCAQILMRFSFLKACVQGVARFNFGNTPTQAATFLLAITTPEKIRSYLSTALQQLPIPKQGEWIEDSTTYSDPLDLAGPLTNSLPSPPPLAQTRSLIQAAIATPLSHALIATDSANGSANDPDIPTSKLYANIELASHRAFSDNAPQ